MASCDVGILEALERLIPLALRATQKSTLGNGVKVLPREQLQDSLPSSWVDETRPTMASEVMRSSAKLHFWSTNGLLLCNFEGIVPAMRPTLLHYARLLLQSLTMH
jgi:hypothetical protein